MKLDFKMGKIFGAVLGLLLFGSLAMANTISVSATGQGSCTNLGTCNNFNPSVISNTFAGSTAGSSVLSSDWFVFNIPNFSGSITGATISIFDNTGNFNNQIALYNLYLESGVTSYANIAVGTLVGSTGVPTQGLLPTIVTINLNGAGLPLLNATKGGQAFFAGLVPNASSLSTIQIFGFTNGSPVATLNLTTAPAPIPEPDSILLLGTGLLGVVGAARRKLTL